MKGSLAAGIDLRLRHADGVGARRGRRPNTGCWPKPSAIRRIFPPSPIGCAPTPSGTTASRSRRGRDLLASTPSRRTIRSYSAYYRHVTKAEKTGEREITFTFDGPGNRELPQIVGQLNVLPKHWWEGTDKSGNKRDITATTLEPPLGCGAYRIKEFVPGRTIVYERVKDYWGKDLNVNIGRDNFDELRFEYFRDTTVALEAFKADAIDWRTENSAKNWATAYDFPAVKDKRVVLEEFPIRPPAACRAYAFNIRRPKFADPRVRRAFNFAFDFEEMNKQMFFGQYKRIDSYFEGTGAGVERTAARRGARNPRDCARQGAARGLHHALHQSGRRQPEEVRANLREATRLLREAGYEVRDQKLVNAKTGEPFTVEMLIDRPEWERIVLSYKPSLERLGIG